MTKSRKSVFHFGVPFLWILGVIFLSMVSVKSVKAGEISPGIDANADHDVPIGGSMY